MAQEDNKVAEAENGVSKLVTFSAMKPLLFVEAPKATDAVQFYKSAFGAEEINRVSFPKRKADQELPLLRSADLKIGSSHFLVSDLSDESSAIVKSVGTGLVFCLETEDIEAAVSQAVKAGATADGEIVDGVANLKDPYGVVWMISSPTPAKKVDDDVEA